MIRTTVKNQIGQTLLETVVGVFIMIMGVTSAIGLAVHSLNASGNVLNQMTAMGLAREGMEAVRNMRDTNWLKDNLSSCDGSKKGGSSPGSSADLCYSNWQKSFYGKNPGTTRPLTDGTYTLDYDTTVADTATFWQLKSLGSTSRLYFNSNPTSGGFYTTVNTGKWSDYYRQVTIVEEQPSYYLVDIGPRLHITVKVWWTDKNCPAGESFPSKGGCGVQLDTYLTNWRNY